MKMVTINNCYLCPHCDESMFTVRYDLYCTKAQRQIDQIYSNTEVEIWGIIPPWCPLPDAPEKEDDTPPGCDGVEILFPGPLPGSLRDA